MYSNSLNINDVAVALLVKLSRKHKLHVQPLYLVVTSKSKSWFQTDEVVDNLWITAPVLNCNIMLEAMKITFGQSCVIIKDA
jgi:hypothetical protein